MRTRVTRMTGTLLASSLISIGLTANALVAPAANAVAIKTPPLSTPWTSLVNPAGPLPGYPRPQMTRPDWQNLNGEWQLRQSTTDDAAGVRCHFGGARQRAVPGRVRTVRRDAAGERQPPLPVLPPHLYGAVRLERAPGAVAGRTSVQPGGRRTPDGILRSSAGGPRTVCSKRSWCGWTRWPPPGSR